MSKSSGPRAFLVGTSLLLLVGAMGMAGCSSILGLGSLHDRSGDGGEGTEDGSADGTTDTGVLPDGTADVGDGSNAKDSTADGEVDARSDGAADAGDAHTDGGDSGIGCVIAGAMYASGAVDPTNACQSCQPGVSTSAWSEATDGTTCGAGGICHTGACVSGCVIGGVYYATNAPDPTNACQSCQPGGMGGATGWTTTDGVNSSCPTNEVCSGTCQSGCWIAGAFYAAGATTNSGCEICTPSSSTTSWTTVPGTGTCTSGEVCNAGACVAGCFIAGAYYAAGATMNSGCEVCTPATSTTSWTNAADGKTCGTGQVCGSGACGTQCDIGGTIVASGSTNPTDPCQSCQPGGAGGTSGWTSTIGVNASCPTGDVCGGSPASCESGCFIAGAFVAPSAANPADPCQTCQPGGAGGTSGWTNTVGVNAACPSGDVCNGSPAACAAGCFIGGTYYAATAVNPANPCQTCTPGGAGGTSGWTSTDGLNGKCPAGDVCNSSPASCTPGCYIAGAFVAPSAQDSANPCLSCQPGGTGGSSNWTSTDGPNSSCASGDVCTSGNCRAGCFIGGTYFVSGTVNPGNSCQSCQPGVSTVGWTTLANGATCAGGDICNMGTCSSGCYIGGTFFTPGTADPTNACESCQPVVTTSNWAPVANGLSCGGSGSGLECKAGACVCDTNSCMKGCCDGSTGLCVPWASEKPSTCGSGGNTCSPCTNGLCDTTNGTCTCDSNTCPSGCCGGTSGDQCVTTINVNNCGAFGSTCETCVAPNMACTSGVCTPCSPGAVQCVGNGVQTCSSSGTWGASVACGVGAMCTAGVCECVKTVTSSEGGTTPFTTNVPVQYSMIGGGAGSGGWGAGGGGSSGIIMNGMLVQYAAGSAPGFNANAVTGSFTLTPGVSFSIYVGGGGGGGGSAGGGGGGAGYYGGGGGCSSAGGSPGTNTGGAEGSGCGASATNGASQLGGNGGTFGANSGGGNGGNGAAGGMGGTPDTGTGGGGGGGGLGAGGGAGGCCSTAGANGGSNAGTGGSTSAAAGGTGASTWAGSTTLPATAGAGGTGYGGGNAGLVIYTYVSPTGTCSF